jgi:hypothetical protein
MGKVINSHPAWQCGSTLTLNRGDLVWPITCSCRRHRETGMADSMRELSQEYWRPAPSPGNQFQANGFQTHEAFCTICGTKYPAGARFCHVCGLSRDEDLPADKRSAMSDWLNFDRVQKASGLPTVSLVLVVVAAVFMLAAVMTGLVYNTSTVADWQAVQTWRIEWLLATVVSLLAAMLFKTSQ